MTDAGKGLFITNVFVGFVFRPCGTHKSEECWKDSRQTHRSTKATGIKKSFDWTCDICEHLNEASWVAHAWYQVCRSTVVVQRTLEKAPSTTALRRDLWHPKKWWRCLTRCHDLYKQKWSIVHKFHRIIVKKERERHILDQVEMFRWNMFISSVTWPFCPLWRLSNNWCVFLCNPFLRKLHKSVGMVCALFQLLDF